jgi:predicted ribosomally synthesized peptide with SipW-like signal peptide
VPHLIRYLALGCALLALASVTVAAWTQDSTIDEPFHIDYARLLVAGEPLTREGIYNSKTPALVPSVWAGNLAIRAGVPVSKQLQAITRLTTALYFVALLAAVFFFVRSLAGPPAGWIAVLCCSLEPNLVAHASLNTVDVAFALANLLALWAMLAFARQADWKTTAWLGLALGFAFTVKFTGLFLVPAVLSLPFWRKDGAWPGRRERLRRAGWVAIAVLLSMLAISAAYYFRDVGRPLSAHAFVTRPFQALSAWLGWLRLPLPEQYLLGVDMVAAHESEGYRVILFDRVYEAGVWYYFLALWFFKTPIALMLATLAGVWLGWRSGALRQPGMTLLFFQSALYLAYFSFLFRTQLGYRFVLMLVPIAFVFLAVGLKDWWAKPKGAYAAAAIALLSLAELAPYFGHALAFSNSFLLPKKDAYRVLADSNLYWGEYRGQIAVLLHQHGMRAVANPSHILPGRNAIDSLDLSGVRWTPLRHQWTRQNLQTSGHLKHVIFLYDVTQREFDRFLDEERRRAPSKPYGGCTGPSSGSVRVQGREAGATQVCVNATEVTDISLAVHSGTAHVVHAGSDDRCTVYADAVEPGGELWFRLEPGTHRICVAAHGELSGVWTVRRGAASFQVRTD